MNKKALSQQEIYDLYEAAKGGSAAALAQLNDVSSYYGKKANERITDFEKADMSSQALARAEHFLESQEGRSRFTRSKKLDAYEAFQNASEARRFLRSKTGTVARQRKREEKTIGKLQEGGYLPEDMSAESKKDFSRFLRSGAWDELKNTMGSQTMKDVAEAINNGADIDELIEAYDEFQESEYFDDFADFLSEWADA